MFAGAMYTGSEERRCEPCGSKIKMFDYAWKIEASEGHVICCCKKCYDDWLERKKYFDQKLKSEIINACLEEESKRA